jgi:dolichyl-phosphate-mannose-protein mannosyltransferase
MNASSTLHVEEEAKQALLPEVAAADPRPPGGALELWLLHHLDALALAVVAAGFVLRILAAARSYLNPDEALHYMLLNQSSAYLAYKASLTNAHPPLIYLVVYYWHFLGRSELMLRLPSVMAGTAFCWMLYTWMGLAFGRVAGWVGLILATFSPPMIELSSELRAYALLLFGIGGALYFLERALAEKSVRQMWLFSGFLYLAILSHYSAVFFAAAAGAYALARIADSHLPRRVVGAWACGQAGALAICSFLYVTHLSKLKSSIAVWNTGFGTAYFHADATDLFHFTWQNTLGIFLFLFRQTYIAKGMLLLFAAGVAFFLWQGLRSPRGSLQSNRLGILLLLPFATVWLASIAGVYPYVGSRHTSFLAPFAIAAGSYVLAVVCGQRLWLAFLVAALLAVGADTAHGAAPTEEIAGDRSPALMVSTVRYLEQSVAPGDVVLVDYQSSLPFAYYLCGSRTIFPVEIFKGNYFEFKCDRYSVVSLHIWKLIAASFPGQFEIMARDHHLRSGTRVWLYESGWGDDLELKLMTRNPAFRCLLPKRFGGGVTVTPYLVGPDYKPQSPLGSC